MNKIQDIDRKIRKSSSLSLREKLRLSSRIYNSLKSENPNEIQRKKLINSYRDITYDITKQDPSHSDPLINLDNLGLTEIYQAENHASDKILKTLNMIRKNEIVFKSDKIDLYNHLLYEKNNTEFTKQLSETPEDLIEKYGKEKTTETRFKYLLSSLEKTILKEEKPSKIKKVLRLSHDYNRNQGGLQEHLQELNKGLASKEGIELYQILPITKKQFKSLEEEGKVRREGNSFIDVYSGSVIKPIFITQKEDERMARLNNSSVVKEYMNQFKDIFEEIDPDIVHIHGTLLPQFLFATIQGRKSCKIIVTHHIGLINTEFHKQKLIILILKFFIHNFIPFFSDKIICVSNHGKKSFIFFKSKIIVINPVPLIQRDNSGLYRIIKKNVLNNKFQINDSDKLYCCFGRMTRQKNQLNIIKAFNNVISRLQNLKLIVVGSDYDTHYSNLVRKEMNRYSKNYCLIKNINNAEAINIIENCDYLISATINEGFGRTGMEAQLLGKPIIASCNSGYEDYIENGKNGLLINPENVEGIQEAIINIKSIQSKAKFSHGKYMKKIINIYGGIK